MKILSIGNFGYGWDGSICDEEHIAQALEELGHEVTRVQRETCTDFDKNIKDWEGDYDFALIAQWDNYPIGLFSVLEDYRVKIAYWAFDYQADGQEWHERLIKESTLYLSKRIADSKYDNWRWLSQDFAPSFLDRIPRKVVGVRGTSNPPTHQEPVYNDVEKDIDVLFTGSYLDWAIERNETLKVVDRYFNLTIHSINHWPDFKNVRQPIMDEGLPELYARAKVILSIDHTIEAGYWSDRNAQIMCCGERPLFRYVPLAEATFHDTVDYFYNAEDCVEQIKQRLEKPTNGAYSYDYAQNHLKVINRVQDLLTIVGSIL